ncbi:contractile injection system protein, VgrG/Pvc8 family [Clostridium sp. Marseille-P2415]|uniref:contractile injection system protein, VgrG/Pvc8 family n=1 Tax=Clostridium sp. Marseille-P2415 TaxID=1805471 RepID=UPI0009884CA2|nr:contractile injection system protein, VgrG/Pvc8 family [Clostridium sp. Marseille-P2415]
MECEGIISCGELKTEPVHFIEIDEIEINRNINEHMLFEVAGRINEEEKGHYTRELNFGTEMIVRYKNGKILFRGLITETELKHQGEFYVLRVKGCSHTVLLDMTKRTRPFHNTDGTYTQIFQSIASEYTGANAVISDNYLTKTDQFLMQYRETDWEFMKRLASHKQQGIIADCTVAHPAYYVGTPKLYTDVENSKGGYQIKKDLKAYKKALDVPEYRAVDAEYITYTVCMDEWLNLGEEVIYKGLKLCVKSAHSVLEHAVLVHRYELCVKEGLNQRKTYNEMLAGKSVMGKVEAVNRDIVKVRVQEEQSGQNTDSNTGVGESCRFPYSTVYATRDGSGWYCMPETGDKVRIIFPDSDEKNAYASSSVSEYQPGPQEKDRMADYRRRYIRNPQGMEVAWTPEQINISANGACVATFDQKGVLTLSANSKIILHSAGDIFIEAGNQIKMNASDCINMVCGGKGEINISQDGVIELKGNEVYTN